MREPILKWVGGKRQLLPVIKSLMPVKFNRYFEPFVGGGALFFHLDRPNSYISDVNPELVNAYKVVADAAQFERLRGLLEAHMAANCKEHYLKIRNLDRDPNFADLPVVERAARFIYLNKTSFNGLARVNSSGHNNTPYNNNDNLRFDFERLLYAHELLAQTEIAQAGFAAVLDHAEAGDFIYFDPPYVPLSQTSSFTSYSKDGFSSDDQAALVAVMDGLVAKGAHVMVSNSWCNETKTLYAGYCQHEVAASRMINADADGRGKIAEMIAHSVYVTVSNETSSREEGWITLP